MTLAPRFDAATRHGLREVPEPELLPTLLSRAAAEAAGVDGAGISMLDELRVPLGASDPVVARAERLQTTLGEGPCLSAAGAGEPVVADGAEMAARWPLYTRELTAQTPYRSVMSVPLRVGGRSLGALDLYSVSHGRFDRDLVEEVCAHVAGPIAVQLFCGPPVDADTFAPPLWLVSDSVIERMDVWVAVGLVLEQAGLDNVAALAVLRSYALRQHRSLDEVAADLTSGRLQPEDVLARERREI
jgi:hypothetical protein